MSKSLKNTLVKGCCKSKSLYNLEGGAVTLVPRSLEDVINAINESININPPVSPPDGGDGAACPVF